VTFDVTTLRAAFPGLHQEVRGKPLTYLDNAATAQMPQAGIDAVARSLTWDRANVHRGVHELAARATVAFDEARETAGRWLGISDPGELIFTRGTTESVNLVANSWGRANLKPGDEILITGMEHHSNIVPWQLVAAATGAKVRAVPLDDRGQLDLGAYEALLNPRTRLVACVHASNALGTLNPVEVIIAMAHRNGSLVLLDGAQALAHLRVDVKALDVDFYAGSAHKLFGPTGVGLLYGKRALLDAMPPFLGGGDMIRRVTLEGSTWNDLPYKFEAGTPNIAGITGFGATLRFCEGFDWKAAGDHEQALLAAATEGLKGRKGVKLVGTARHKVPVLSFTVDYAAPSDIGEILNQMGVAIRTGHHCAQPVMDHFGVSATARASFAFYNTHADVERFLDAMTRAERLLA
jgi:cysteine desulfurase/selenocysteine lyase